MGGEASRTQSARITIRKRRRESIVTIGGIDMVLVYADMCWYNARCAGMLLVYC